MKTLKCSDLGSEHCSYEASGESNQEIIDTMFKHAGEVHPEKVEAMNEEEKKGMVQKMNELLDKQE